MILPLSPSSIKQFLCAFILPPPPPPPSFLTVDACAGVYVQVPKPQNYATYRI